MYSDKCNLDGKRGIEILDHAGDYTMIANRTLYAHGQARKFAVVNTRRHNVDSVFSNRNRARSVMYSLNRNA